MYGSSKKRVASGKSSLAVAHHPAKRRDHAVARLHAALDQDELQRFREAQPANRPLDSQLRWSEPGSWLQGSLLQTLVQASLQRQDRRQHRGKATMRSLREHCCIQLAMHIWALAPADLGLLPIHQARLIWQAMQALLPGNLQVWMLFASAFPTEFDQLAETEATASDLAPLVARRMHVGLAELPQCITFLHKPTRAKSDVSDPPWHVLLDISDMPLALDLALQFGGVRKLLVLAAADAQVNVSTVRHWCRAQSVGKFVSLEMLDLGVLELPWAVVLELAAFPALRWLACASMPDWPHWIRACLVNTEAWQASIEKVKQTPCLDILVHLGSRADARAVCRSAPEDVTRLDLSKVRRIQAGLPSAKMSETAPIVAKKKGQRSKKSAMRNTASIWSGIL